MNHIESYIAPLFTKGFFLEIGAWSGEHISQTKILELNGWHGLCVDPFPKHFEDRTCMLCPKAVSKDGKDRTFIKVTIDRRYGGDVSYFSGFKDSINFHWPVIEKHCNYDEINIKTVTISDLYKQYMLPDYIEFLSIDTEGSEFEILSSIDFNKYSFGAIMFEHNGNETVRRVIADLLMKSNFLLHKELDLDSIYIHKSLV